MAELSTPLLRELLRNLEGWKVLYESSSVDTICDHEGNEWSLWDLINLVDEGLPRLPPRQRQAIELFLLQNMREKDAAVVMGVSITNPVAMYATAGLEKLVAMVASGEIRPLRGEMV